jgi:S-adenosylmethionine:tRNA ribosyltransferase-isomerase
MDISVFEFHLPQDRIALRPVSPRDSARMLVVHGDGSLEHSTIRDLPNYLRSGDALVANDTRVIAARLKGMRLREAGPAKIELLLHRRLSADRYSALARPMRKLAVGDSLVFGDLSGTVAAHRNKGEVEIVFALAGAALDAAIARLGEIPLPPYIAGKRDVDAQDALDYQTLFAGPLGSVAAPTAGLHFTPGLLARLAEKGVSRELVTLHVGLGTFLPVTVSDTQNHQMHSEFAMLSADTASRLNALRHSGGRIFAVGTTSLRTLESAADGEGILHPLAEETDIFITPGYAFRCVQGLLTNFHLPRSWGPR